MGVINMEPGQRVQQYDRNLDLDLGEDIRYLDSGGEHAVYTMADPAWNTEVAKVNYAAMRALLDANARAGRRLDTISADWRAHHEAEVDRRLSEYRKLRQYFGYHIPEQKTQIAMISVTNEHIRLLYGPDQEPPDGYEAVEQLPTVLTLQEKVPLTELPNYISLHFGSLDVSHLTEKDLRDLQDKFHFTDSAAADYAVEIERLYPSLKPIIDIVTKDPTHKNKVREFVESLIAYTSDTGQGLDLVGKDNVVFYGQDALLDYRLLDVIQLEPKDFLTEAQLFEEWLKDQKPDTNIAEVVPDNIHFLRAINALAWLSGSDKRLVTIQGKDIMAHVAQVVGFLREKKLAGSS